MERPPAWGVGTRTKHPQGVATSALLAECDEGGWAELPKRRPEGVQLPSAQPDEVLVGPGDDHDARASVLSPATWPN